MLRYVFNFFNRIIIVLNKVPHKGAVIEIGVYKNVKKVTSNSLIGSCISSV